MPDNMRHHQYPYHPAGHSGTEVRPAYGSRGMSAQSRMNVGANTLVGAVFGPENSNAEPMVAYGAPLAVGGVAGVGAALYLKHVGCGLLMSAGLGVVALLGVGYVLTHKLA